jgi:hypothetical protein
MVFVVSGNLKVMPKRISLAQMYYDQKVWKIWIIFISGLACHAFGVYG